MLKFFSGVIAGVIVFEKLYSSTPLFYMILMLFSIFVAWLLFVNEKINKNEIYLVLVGVIVLLFGVLINSFYNPSYLYGFMFLVKVIGSFFFARILIFFKAERPFLMVMYCLLILAIGLCVYNNGINPESYNNIFFESSRNVVSGWLVLLSIGIVIVMKIERDVWYIWPLFISFAFSLLLVGRSSIIVSGIALICVGLIGGKKFFLKTFLAVVVVACFIWYNDIIYIWEYTAFAENGFDTPRYNIWAGYIHDMNLFSFLFGHSMSGIAEIAVYNTNPHNSFVMMHSFFGMAPLLLFIVVLYCYYSSFNWFLFFLVFLMLVRASSDVLFWGYDAMDIVFFLVFQKIALSTKNPEVSIMLK